MLHVLLKIARDKKEKAPARVQAAGLVLSFGWGRPHQSISIDAALVQKKLHELTPDELARLESKLIDATIVQPGEQLELLPPAPLSDGARASPEVDP
jgi:hypothetical protein